MALPHRLLVVAICICLAGPGAGLVARASADGVDVDDPVKATPTTIQQPTVSIGDVVDIGDDKPSRFYDDYLAAALADLTSWWATEFPGLYDEPYAALEGGIFAAYPERTDPIPGCGGSAETTYQEVSDFAAFYCPRRDFIVYDDGDLGLIHELAADFSPSVVAVVMAHELGHAIQFRSGDLDRDVPTVVTEQQADCFSGAWSGRAWRGEAAGLRFTDEDIRTGLIALVSVADPIGTDVFEPGGHGAAFDRIGAFQLGFDDGLGACAPLIDNPLPLLPNEFGEGPGSRDEMLQGNAPFGDEPGQIVAILDDDLSFWWPRRLAEHGVVLPEITIRDIGDPSTDHCRNPQRLLQTGALFCTQTDEILFDRVTGRVLYDDFGDFAVGYVVGLAYADAVQDALDSQLAGQRRALASDCLFGAWIGSAIAGIAAGPGATTTSTSVAGEPQRPMTVSPGDLDEAIQVALRIGDRRLDDNLEGSAYEKIQAIRLGVLDGLSACLAQINS